MSDGVTIKLEGFRELERALVELEKDAPRAIAKGLKPPMQKTLEDMRSLAPYDPESGYHIRDALALTPVKRATARRASMADSLSEVGVRLLKVGTKGDWPRNYYWLVEQGTSHSAPKPYIRPAFDRNVDGMISGFKVITSEEIVRIWNRYAKRRAA